MPRGSVLWPLLLTTALKPHGYLGNSHHAVSADRRWMRGSTRTSWLPAQKWWLQLNTGKTVSASCPTCKSSWDLHRPNTDKRLFHSALRRKPKNMTNTSYTNQRGEFTTNKFESSLQTKSVKHAGGFTFKQVRVSALVWANQRWAVLCNETKPSDSCIATFPLCFFKLHYFPLNTFQKVNIYVCHLGQTT